MIKPILHVVQTQIQPIQNHQSTAMAMQVKVRDDLNVFNTAAGQNTRYYPTIPGRYRCFGQVTYDVSDGGDRSCIFLKNGQVGNDAPAGTQRATTGGGNVPGMSSCTADIFLNGINDYVQLSANQHDGGATLNTFYSPGTWVTFMIIEWFGP